MRRRSPLLATTVLACVPCVACGAGGAGAPNTPSTVVVAPVASSPAPTAEPSAPRPEQHASSVEPLVLTQLLEVSPCSWLSTSELPPELHLSRGEQVFVRTTGGGGSAKWQSETCGLGPAADDAALRAFHPPPGVSLALAEDDPHLGTATVYALAASPLATTADVRDARLTASTVEGTDIFGVEHAMSGTSLHLALDPSRAAYLADWRAQHPTLFVAAVLYGRVVNASAPVEDAVKGELVLPLGASVTGDEGTETRARAERLVKLFARGKDR